MQGRNYIPSYHTRDIDVGSGGFSWHLLNRSANYVEENDRNITLRPFNMEQCLSYDKETLGQIIQNHDSMFRYQVQELHRLYKIQKELMDEMRLRKISLRHSISQTSESIHSFSHARSDISQATTSWLTSDNIQKLPKFSYFHYGNEVKFQKRTVDIGLSDNVYLGDQTNHFKETSHSEGLKLARNSPKKHWAATDSVKTGDLSSLDLNDRKKNCCLIDLNEPVHVESLPSSPKCLTETNTRCMEIAHNESGLPNSGGSSDGTIYSPVIIDLNSMPSEIEVNLEHIRAVKEETAETPHKPLKTDIDLNTDVVTIQPLNPMVQIESVVNEGLVGPVSPENKECSPPRGESEGNIQLEILSVELDNLAAQTLCTISARGAHKCLSWFAEIACFGAVSLDLSSEENDDLNVSSCIFEKEKETGTLLSGKKHAKGKRRQRDSLDVGDAKGFLETGRKRAYAKQRKCSKVDKVLDWAKKPVGSVLKKAESKQVLQSWGKMKKRNGGLRRKAATFPVIS